MPRKIPVCLQLAKIGQQLLMILDVFFAVQVYPMQRLPATWPVTFVKVMRGTQFGKIGSMSTVIIYSCCEVLAGPWQSPHVSKLGPSQSDICSCGS